MASVSVPREVVNDDRSLESAVGREVDHTSQLG